MGEGNDIEEKQVLDLLGLFTIENGSLDGGTIGNGLIGVDGSVELLAVEEVGEHLLDLGDTGRTADKDDRVVDRVKNVFATLRGLRAVR